MLRSPVYCMKVMNENLLATGDDDGCVKVNVVQDLKRRELVLKSVWGDLQYGGTSIQGTPSRTRKLCSEKRFPLNGGWAGNC